MKFSYGIMYCFSRSVINWLCTSTSSLSKEKTGKTTCQCCMDPGSLRAGRELKIRTLEKIEARKNELRVAS